MLLKIYVKEQYFVIEKVVLHKLQIISEIGLYNVITVNLWFVLLLILKMDFGI